jgi:dolichyl-phosphate beta-glucosyltransferase
MTARPKISVIVPCYREADRIASTVERLLAQIDVLDLDGEVVVVDDGCPEHSGDRVRGIDRVRVEHHELNRGKGAAVRTGLLAATGDVIGFVDADLGGGAEVLAGLLDLIVAGADVAIGSRPFARDHQSPFRWLCSAAAVTGTRLVGLGVADSQCGAKLFTRAAGKALADAATVDRFAFDLEYLYLARQLGFRIAEHRLDGWEASDRSTVRPVRDTLSAAADLIRIVNRHRSTAGLGGVSRAIEAPPSPAVTGTPASRPVAVAHAASTA